MKYTRKIKNTIYLKYLPKTRGGRIENLATFQVVCSSKDAHAKLKGIRTLKSPLESDDFIHVVFAKFGNKDLIVKIQEDGTRTFQRELEIQEKLKNTNNIITFICDFICNFDDIIWNKPLERPRYLCDEKGTPLHCIVMEYINSDLTDVLKTIENTDILISILQQLGLCLMNIHINYGVYHGDINKGNILVEKGEPKILTYTINNISYDVNTLGYECIFIDFQRGGVIPLTNMETLLILTVNEISLTYELVSNCINPIYKDSIRALSHKVEEMKSIEQLSTFITSFIPAPNGI